MGSSVDAANGFANVSRSFFRIERRIRSKKNAIDAKEIEAALHGGARAECGRVGVKHFEIFLRPIFQAAAVYREIFVIGTGAQLI